MNKINEVLFAFLITLFAGLSTGVGSLIAFFAKPKSEGFLSFSLGFSAGVMIYVSLVEILSKARDALDVPYGDKYGLLFTTIGFFGGILLIEIIEVLIPEKPRVKSSAQSDNAAAMKRAGTLTAVAIAIHNFPEGLATFVSSLRSPALALPVAAAIAIHNIPEGIAVSVPVYSATGSKRKAFVYSLLSGITEPLGAIIGYMILMPFMSDTVYGILFASVSGIMVYISVSELIPSACKYGRHRLMINGIVAGMAVMALSLWLFV